MYLIYVPENQKRHKNSLFYAYCVPDIMENVFTFNKNHNPLEWMLIDEETKLQSSSLICQRSHSKKNRT